MTNATSDAAALDAEALAAWNLPFPATPYDLWTRTNVGEVFPHVVTPLTWSVYNVGALRLLDDQTRTRLIPRDLFKDGMPPLLFAPINGRLFFNLGLTYHIVTDRFGLPSWFYSLSLGGPMESERLGLPPRGFRPLRMLPRAHLLLQEQARLDGVVRDFHQQAAGMRAEALRLRAESLDALPLPDLLARLDRITESAYAPYVQLLDGSAAALNAYGALAWLCERWAGDRTLANDLVTGLANLLTARASVSLWGVARAAKANPAAERIIRAAPPAELRQRLRAEPGAAIVSERLDRFFAQHGHRAADEFELSVPRWSDDPAFVQSTLRAYFDAPEEMDPTSQLQRQARKRKAAERTAKRRMSGGGLNAVIPWRWWVFQASLKRTRSLLPMRENPKFHFLLYAAEMRRTILAAGERLRAIGHIAAIEDVFYLMRSELDAAARGEPLDLRAHVAAAKRLHARFEAWQPPEVIAAADVEAVKRMLPPAATVGDASDAPAAPDSLDTATAPSAVVHRLTGIAASAGRVTGRARVARTPEEGAEIEPGEILVAPFTDPGWTPLFPVAGAIVMDLGGLLSHGAIVAREYGIPAVVNTRTATALLTTGQEITVDGDTGHVSWT